MKVLTRRILSLVLLLTQAATTFASPAFSLCISPKGHVCIDTPWNECTCCQDETQDEQPAATGEDGAAARQEEDAEDGKCRCSHCRLKSRVSAAPALPGEQPPGTWQGKPCRCKHIPLAVVQDATDVATPRVSVVDRSLSLGDFAPGDCGPIFGNDVTFTCVNLLPHPPPAHLLSIACTVLRC